MRATPTWPRAVFDAAGAVAGTGSIDGNPLPQVPEWISHLTARYGGQRGKGGGYVLTDWSCRSEVNFFLYESREFVGDPLLQGGLRLACVWGDRIAMGLGVSFSADEVQGHQV